MKRKSLLASASVLILLIISFAVLMNLPDSEPTYGFLKGAKKFVNKGQGFAATDEYVYDVPGTYKDVLEAMDKELSPKGFSRGPAAEGEFFISRKGGYVVAVEPMRGKKHAVVEVRITPEQHPARFWVRNLYYQAIVRWGSSMQ